MVKWVGDREKAQNEIQERLGQINECNQKIDKTTRAGAELDVEIRILQAGVGRRNSCASQSNGYCFDPAVVEQFITVGATQAWQQLAFIQGELGSAASASASHSGARARGWRRLPKARWTLGNMRRCFLLQFMIGQSLLGVNAASQNARNRSGLQATGGKRFKGGLERKR